MIEKFIFEGTQGTLLEQMKNKQDLLPKQFLDMPIDNLRAIYAKDVKEPMSPKTKKEIQEKTGWSEEITDQLVSEDEAEVYMNANVEEMEVDGRKDLVKTDIDLELKDEFGRTNLERMECGLSPITADGSKIELHHIGQKENGSLVELTTEEHRGTANDMILHDKTRSSEIDRVDFRAEREAHWKERARLINESKQNVE